MASHCSNGPHLPMQPCVLPPFDSLTHVGILRPIQSIWKPHWGLSAPWGLPIRYSLYSLGKRRAPKAAHANICKRDANKNLRVLH